MIKKTLFLFLLLLICAPAWAARYASPTGVSGPTDTCQSINVPCSLARAIAQAGVFNDPVLLVPGFNGETQFAINATLIIDKNLTLRANTPGERFYLAGNNTFSILNIRNPNAGGVPPIQIISVSISDLNMSGGVCTNCDGGIINQGPFVSLTLRNTDISLAQGENGGCIYSEGNLVIEDSSVRGCIAGSRGGSIFSTGSLTLRRAQIIGSRARGNDAGGIYASGTVLIQSSLFRGNYVFNGSNNAEAGQAMVLEGAGSKEIIRSTILNNFDTGNNAFGFAVGYEIALRNAQLTLNQSVVGFSPSNTNPAGTHHPACGLIGTISGNPSHLIQATYSYVSDDSCEFGTLNDAQRLGSQEDVVLSLHPTTGVPERFSPVVNTVNTNCINDLNNTSRSYGCDAGALELQIAAGCGNSLPDAGEQCDDGNTADGDGCSATCQHEGNVASQCGNGFQEAGEQCDDGNTIGGDGCSATCQVEAANPAIVCGNQVQEAGEQCDDGNTNNGDGCSSTCQSESVNPGSNPGLPGGSNSGANGASGGGGCSLNKAAMPSMSVSIMMMLLLSLFLLRRHGVSDERLSLN